MEETEFDEIDCEVSYAYDPIQKDAAKHSINKNDYLNFNDAL